MIFEKALGLADYVVLQQLCLDEPWWHRFRYPWKKILNQQPVLHEMMRVGKLYLRSRKVAIVLLIHFQVGCGIVKTDNLH